MNKIGITALYLAGTGAAVLAAVVGVQFRNANQIAAKKCENDAWNEMSQEEADLIAKYETTMDFVEEIKKKEDKLLKEKVENFKDVIGYSDIKRQAIADRNSGLEAFKEAISYDEKKNDAEMEYENTIESFKTAKDYDSKIDDYEDKIKEAERVYERQVRMLDIVDDSEQSESVKKAAKKEKKAIIKEAKEKIEELEKELEKVTSEAEETRFKKIQDLENQVAKEDRRLQIAANVEVGKAASKISDFKESARKEIIANRSEEDSNMINECGRLKAEEEALLDALNNKGKGKWLDMSFEEKMAYYYVQKEIPAPMVVGVGMLPVVLCSIGLYYVVLELVKYTGRVFTVAKTMKKFA